LLSAGVDFDLFTRQVEVACRAGASGYIAGRAVWKEGIALPPSEGETWLQEVAVPRLVKLAEIAHRHARPWTDFFPPGSVATPDGWYASYPGLPD
jgi:tagatose 1,6-diphosphate aldolase